MIKHKIHGTVGNLLVKQVAQRHEEVSGTLALLQVVVPKLGVGRAVDPIGDNVL